jgi:hypothetical protein
VVAGAGAAAADTPPGMTPLDPDNRVRLEGFATTLRSPREQLWPIDVLAYVASAAWAPRADTELRVRIGRTHTRHDDDPVDVDLGNLELSAQRVRVIEGARGRVVQSASVAIVIGTSQHEDVAIDGARVTTVADPLGSPWLWANRANGAGVGFSHRSELGDVSVQADARLFVLDGGDPRPDVLIAAGEGEDVWAWTQLGVGTAVALPGPVSAGAAIGVGLPALSGSDTYVGLRSGVEAWWRVARFSAEVLFVHGDSDGKELAPRWQLAVEARW